MKTVDLMLTLLGKAEPFRYSIERRIPATYISECSCVSWETCTCPGGKSESLPSEEVAQLAAAHRAGLAGSRAVALSLAAERIRADAAAKTFGRKAVI